MNLIKDDRGAVAVLESSLIFPICFFALFLLLFFSIHLFYKVNRDALIRRNLIEETTSPNFEKAEENPLAGHLNASFTMQGLLFKKLEINDQLSKRGMSPYKYFSMEDVKNYTSIRRARRSSSANQLWFMQALLSFDP